MCYANFHGKIFVHPDSTVSEQMNIRDMLGIEAHMVRASKSMWRALEQAGNVRCLEVVN